MQDENKGIMETHAWFGMVGISTLLSFVPPFTSVTALDRRAPEVGRLSVRGRQAGPLHSLETLEARLQSLQRVRKKGRATRQPRNRQRKHKKSFPPLTFISFARVDQNYYMITDCIVYNSGMVFWVPPVTFKTACDLDYTYWPWDVQTCR